MWLKFETALFMYSKIQCNSCSIFIFQRYELLAMMHEKTILLKKVNSRTRTFYDAIVLLVIIGKVFNITLQPVFKTRDLSDKIYCLLFTIIDLALQYNQGYTA